MYILKPLVNLFICQGVARRALRASLGLLLLEEDLLVERVAGPTTLVHPLPASFLVRSYLNQKEVPPLPEGEVFFWMMDPATTPLAARNFK